LRAITHESGGSSHSLSAAAKLLRKQGYLVPNQAAYQQAKAAAAARYGQRAPSHLTNAARSGRKAPLIASGDPDIGPAWTGQQDPNVTPPDTTGAIGPTRYVELVNDQYAIYDRAGNVISSGGLQAFAGSNTPNVTDPQVIWDPGTGRFYTVVLDFSQDFLYVSYSRTASPSDASSSWCKYILDYSLLGLPDYPKLGDSRGFWMIGSNIFAPNYIGSDVAWISKPPSGTGCPNINTFNIGDLPGPLLLDDGVTQAFTPVPANGIDTSNTGYVVATPPSGGSYIDSYAVTGDPSTGFGAPVRHDVTAYAAPPNAPQSGTTKTLDTLDARLTMSVAAIDPSKGGTAIWTEHTVAGGAGSKVNWYEFDPNANAAFRSGSVSDGSLYTFNAAISPDRLVNGGSARFGDTFVVAFDTSSASDFERIQMVSQWQDRAPSEFVEVKASPSFNDDFSCNLNCRWGDYAGASPDPGANAFSNHGSIWLANQWNVLSSDPSIANWRTYVWATHPVPFVILTNPSTLFKTSTKFVVSWVLGNQASAADVQYRQAPYNGGFGAPILWQSKFPGSGSPTFTGAAGNTNCFSAQSYDDTNSGPRPWGFTAERCAVVPLDDRALGASGGWSRLKGKGFYLGTFTQTTGSGKSLSKGGIQAKNIQLLVETCPTCGSINIYWNNKLQHSYSLHASKTHKLVYLKAASFKTVQTGTIKIVSTSSGLLVVIDGLGVSRV
jgi:hypothetical protein